MRAEDRTETFASSMCVCCLILLRVGWVVVCCFVCYLLFDCDVNILTHTHTPHTFLALYTDPPGLVIPNSPTYTPLDHRREVDEPAVGVLLLLLFCLFVLIVFVLGDLQKHLTPEEIEEQIAAKVCLHYQTIFAKNINNKQKQFKPNQKQS
jgi:hypothetical protein